jgi:hypothetical protein
MGVDAVLLVKLREPPEDAETYYITDPSIAWVDAPYTVNADLGRYWSPSYNRGHWPHLLTAILETLQDENVLELWYGSDCGERFEKMTPKSMLRLTKEWMRQNLPRRR